MNVVGKSFGSYRVRQLIGEGGMGQVYLAEHDRLGRKVALKILKPELAHRADLARRFLEEARAVNDIRHPQIVDIYDFIEDYARTPPLVCMVMELLRGESLATHIARVGPLPWTDVVRIAIQVTEVLEAVHARRILHRDLKAENIFLLDGPARTGAGELEEPQPRIKLLDFGSIKSLDAARQLHLTDPGTALGTPEYMAPEQVLGDPLDERTDVYALGVVLYKMMSGSVPFSSPSYGGLMVEVLNKPPPSLAARPGHTASRSHAEWRGPTPKALEQVVFRCLQKKAKRRYSSMAELRASLLDAEADAKPSRLFSRASMTPLAVVGERTAASASMSSGATFAPRRKHRLLLVVAAVFCLASALVLLRGRSGSPTRSSSRGIPARTALPDQPPSLPPAAESLDGAVRAPAPQEAQPGTSAVPDPPEPEAASLPAGDTSPERRGRGGRRGAKKPPRRAVKPESTTVDPFSM